MEMVVKAITDLPIAREVPVEAADKDVVFM